MLCNPYIAGNPVQGQEHFIGRADVLYDVEQTLRNPNANAIVLFGQRRIGKTSVLLQIEQQLAVKAEFTPIYFDLQDKAALPLGEVLYQMAQVVAQITQTPLPEHDKFDAQGCYFRETFMPQAVQQCHKQGIALLLDEFDVLDMPQREQARVAFFPYLRDWMRVAEGLQFVFVLGRRPEELSTDTLSTFKGIRARRVSLMEQDDTEAIIRQSEHNHSIRWSAEAVARVWHWTQGHPYFTQLLCSEVWESAIAPEGFNGFGDDSDAEAAERELPVVTATDVDAALDGTLDQGANALQWIWTGLPPAERIIMAAMAEASAEQITQEELTETLNRSKVRLILRDLELAPETLISWDLLRKIDESSYRFAIPLLRRWVATEKPLRRVKADLDSIEPLAESLYQSAEGFARMGNIAEAERLLRNALDVNPYHFKTRLQLAEVLLAKGDPGGAVKELEPAYAFDSRSARANMVLALLALAESQKEDAEQLATYGRVLAVSPEEDIATEKRRKILYRQAEQAVNAGDLVLAITLYHDIGDQPQEAALRVELRKRELAEQVRVARQHEVEEDWTAAIAVYDTLLAEFPDEGDWQGRRSAAQIQKELAEAYTRALTALEQGKSELARDVLRDMIIKDPNYKDAIYYLLLAVKGTDVEALSQQLQQARLRIQPPPPPPKTEKVDLKINHQAETVSPPGEPFEFDVITVNEQGQAVKHERCKAYQQIDDLGQGVLLEMVYIPGGTFLMGSPENENGRREHEGPQHRVTLAPFYMGKYPITQEQWEAVIEGKKSFWGKKKSANPSHFKDPKRPVEKISWNDTIEFCQRLSEKTGKTYRLPSEAEWEYACRAGTQTAYSFGDDASQLKNYAWYSKNSDNQTHPVGQLRPNAFGVYDMHGNVWEWVADTYHDNYTGAPDNGDVWGNLGDGKTKVLRGGSWYDNPVDLRCAYRDYDAPDNRISIIGARLVRAR